MKSEDTVLCLIGLPRMGDGTQELKKVVLIGLDYCLSTGGPSGLLVGRQKFSSYV